MPKLSIAEAAYLAGILDGEGWIGVARRKRTWATEPDREYYLRPACSIGQAKRELLDYIVGLVGAGSFRKRKGDRIFYELKFDTSTLRWLLPEVMPYLVLKRRQAELVLSFIEDCKYQGRKLTTEDLARREAIRVELEILNTKPASRKPLEVRDNVITFPRAA